MKILEDYYSLHEIPELDCHLPKTLAYITETVSTLGCTLFSPSQSALCAFFDFGKAETLAFRADMDALPLQEDSSIPHRSRHDGQMHACGHDGHTAILLELARRISQKGTLPHNILLIFQPAEETDGGANPICRANVLQNYRVKAIFGLHLWPRLPAGRLYSKPGPLMCCSSGIHLTFYGKSEHIAHHRGRGDALAACCRFYTRAATIGKGDGQLVKFGCLQGGTAPNIICDKAQIWGSVRAFQEKHLLLLQKRLKGVCKAVAYTTGCNGQIAFSTGYPAVINSPELFAAAGQVCPCRVLKKGFMTTDDFSVYQQYVPGLYYLLGLGDTPPLHSSHFTFDPALLEKGASFFEQLALSL